MKSITTLLILIALAMSTFTGCSSSSSNNETNTTESNTTVPDTNTTEPDTNTTTPITKSYIINTLENKDIPSTASMLAQSSDTKVKITRDVESEMMNVYVISGSVEVSEVVE